MVVVVVVVMDGGVSGVELESSPCVGFSSMSEQGSVYSLLL